MPELKIYGASDDCVEFEGAIYDEFYLSQDNTWTGVIKSPKGDVVTVRASYYVDNPNGWDVRILSASHAGAPWPYRKKSVYGNEEGTEENTYITLDVPAGSTVESISG